MVIQVLFSDGWFIDMCSLFYLSGDRYRVGTDLLIEFKFRTWAASGVFLTVQSSKYPDGLALEMINGSVSRRECGLLIF